MQHNMPMENMKPGMHNTFWRNDQIMVVFHSDLPLRSATFSNEGVLLDKLNPSLLKLFNDELQHHNSPVTLRFLDDSEEATSIEHATFSKVSDGALSKSPAGICLFGTNTPAEDGLPNTSIISFFHIRSEHYDDESLIPKIVNTLNDRCQTLNHDLHKDGITMAFAAPALLCGGTPKTGQGCTLLPPIPVEEPCRDWHIGLPNLDSDPSLQSSQGNGVTVFILDAFPERGVISRAAQDAGKANRLLQNVDKTAIFDYSLLSGIQEISIMENTHNAGAVKDVYGRHYSVLVPDHGLFIAGIVRDIAPKANIECIRVLDGLCVGDLHTLIRALEKINNRMLPPIPGTDDKENLYQKPVVINLSLVIPTDDQLQQQHITTRPHANNHTSIIETSLRDALTNLTRNGAIIVASAGNEGDNREVPDGSTRRPMALYPAAMSKDNKSIMAVGAVTAEGQPATYSCYPGSDGIATLGGEFPDVQPGNSRCLGSDHPTVTMTDPLRGIYSSVEYPPLSAAPYAQYCAAPNTNAWAYWIGTSFATPIVSAAMARIMEAHMLKLEAAGSFLPQNALKARDTLMSMAPETATWDKLVGVNGTATGHMLKAVQKCRSVGSDDV